MATARVPSEQELRMARACIARALVRENVLQPEDALAVTVWPSALVGLAERLVNRNTIASRAYSMKLNE